VDQDILEIAEYLFNENEAVAVRFIDSVQTTLKDLAAAPKIGSVKSFKDRRLANVRSWRVKGFPNHLILYEPLQDGILVLAVIHGARDLQRFLKRRI
jgi:toxin ParE1/3/4